MPHPLIRTGLLFALCTGCGPGSPGGDESPPPEPEWAYGWWMDSGGLQDHFEWGAYTMQMEIRPDGTVFQIADYCNGEDWTYESRWELQSDGSVRILPKEGDVLLPFQLEMLLYQYVDIRPNAGSCELTAVRIGQVDGTELPITIERGRWCVGKYLPEFNECELELYCGESPPVCD